ncbi:hypothetical protein COOONC_09561 [Cooperia oncophora]
MENIEEDAVENTVDKDVALEEDLEDADGDVDESCTPNAEIEEPLSLAVTVKVTGSKTVSDSGGAEDANTSNVDMFE